MEVTKVYPEVKDGQFRTDFRFTTGRPENIRAGQTYHINLQLGDPVKAVLIPRGGFFKLPEDDGYMLWMKVVNLPSDVLSRLAGRILSFMK